MLQGLLNSGAGISTQPSRCSPLQELPWLQSFLEQKEDQATAPLGEGDQRKPNLVG